MRIISGLYKGRKLEGFDINGTRPTMDRIKESIFGIIQNNIKDAIVLDLFAGSGSLGLEALSNGAKEVYLIDNNDIAIKTIKKNSKDMENTHIIKEDFKKYLEKTNTKFDLVFLDPPYQKHLINEALELIKKYQILNDNGIIVCEYEDEVIDNFYQLLKARKYGTKEVKIFKNN